VQNRGNSKEVAESYQSYVDEFYSEFDASYKIDSKEFNSWLRSEHSELSDEEIEAIVEYSIRDQNNGRGSEELEINEEDIDDEDIDALIDGFGTFLNTVSAEMIRRYGRKQLRHADVVRLARRKDMGDKKALEEMILGNVLLVVHIAKRFQDFGVPMEDLVQYGILGLIRAAERFDWRMGFRFSTYATHWIRQSILRGADLEKYVVRPIGNAKEEMRMVHEVRERLSQEYGREPTTKEIVRELQKAGRLLEEQEVVALMSIMSAPTSLDILASTDNENGSAIVDLLSAEDNSIEDWVEQALPASTLHDALQRMPDAIARVLCLYHGIGCPQYTLEEIGRFHGHITRERARQVLEQGHRILRYILCQQELELPASK